MAGSKASQQEIKCVRAIVHGRVQGVSFRYYAREKARSLGLVGYVRNRWDGTVKVVAEGPADALGQFLSWLHVGPSMASVSRVEVVWLSPKNESCTFEVRF